MLRQQEREGSGGWCPFFSAPGVAEHGFYAWGCQLRMLGKWRSWDRECAWLLSWEQVSKLQAKVEARIHPGDPRKCAQGQLLSSQVVSDDWPPFWEPRGPTWTVAMGVTIPQFPETGHWWDSCLVGGCQLNCGFRDSQELQLGRCPAKVPWGIF